MNAPHEPSSDGVTREAPGVHRLLGILASLMTGGLLLVSALWSAWKGPFVGFDPVRGWMIAGGVLFFASIGGFVFSRHHLGAWRWFVMAIIHSLSLSAFGKFADETGILVEYQRWVTRGSWSQPSSMVGLLSLYVLGAFVTAWVSFRILRRHA